MKIQIKRLPNLADLSLPAYETDGAAAMDVRAAIEEDVAILPGSIATIPCGFAVAIPIGFEAQIRPRSGLALRDGIIVPNSPGTIDPDYRGEVKVLLLNQGAEPFRVTRGMRIAQMIVAPVLHVQWEEVQELPPSTRGEGGYGHTGR